jgi:DNA-binding NarL/FixJ family response regulator
MNNRQVIEAETGIYFSKREFEILVMSAAGFSKKEIAAFLGVCYDTVKKHSSNIRDKVGVKSMLKLSAWYYTVAFPIIDKHQKVSCSVERPIILQDEA